MKFFSSFAWFFSLECMMMFVQEPVDFNSRIGPACLPEADNDYASK
jgi:hypothetical protein